VEFNVDLIWINVYVWPAASLGQEQYVELGDKHDFRGTTLTFMLGMLHEGLTGACACARVCARACVCVFLGGSRLCVCVWVCVFVFLQSLVGCGC
jgi:hypothetical protein